VQSDNSNDGASVNAGVFGEDFDHFIFVYAESDYASIVISSLFTIMRAPTQTSVQTTVVASPLAPLYQ
jgi:hypothetical protein